MILEFKAKTDPDEIKKEAESNEWLKHLRGEHEAPPAVKRGKKRKTKVSTRQQQAIRSAENGR